MVTNVLLEEAEKRNLHISLKASTHGSSHFPEGFNARFSFKAICPMMPSGCPNSRQGPPATAAAHFPEQACFVLTALMTRPELFAWASQVANVLPYCICTPTLCSQTLGVFSEAVKRKHDAAPSNPSASNSSDWFRNTSCPNEGCLVKCCV